MFHYKESQLVYHGKRFDVLKFSEGKAEREVVSHRGAAVILPLLDPTTVLLIKNKRECVLQTLIELPAGMLNRDEDPLDCAKRELEEETGYRAQKITPLLHFFTTPGFCNEIIYAFLAEDLIPTKQSLDSTEEITLLPTPLHEAYRMIKEGIIIDSKTITTLLYYKS